MTPLFCQPHLIYLPSLVIARHKVPKQSEMGRKRAVRSILNDSWA